MRKMSLDNGVTWMTADEAMPAVEYRDLWDAVVGYMDDATRERVHAELAPCTERVFLCRYLELATEDLVVG